MAMKRKELQQKLKDAEWSGGYVEIDWRDTPIYLDEPLRFKDVALVGHHRVPIAFPARPTFVIPADFTEKSPIICSGSGTGLVGCSFKYEGQTDSRNVKKYPPTVLVLNDPVSSMFTMFNCHFNNAWQMIDIQRGRYNLDYIFGQVLHTGIRIKGTQDFSRINNIHFWPFWSPHAIQYSEENKTTGIIIDKSDWPQMSNLAFYGLYTAMFLRSKEGLSDPQITNFAADACNIAIELNGVGLGGMQIANFRTAGTYIHGGSDAIGIYAREDAKLRSAAQIANAHFHGNIGPHWIWPDKDDDMLQVENEFQCDYRNE